LIKDGVTMIDVGKRLRATCITILKLFDRKEVRQMAAINMRTTQLTLVKGCGFLKLGNQLREKLL
jgi:hypothetical protein